MRFVAAVLLAIVLAVAVKAKNFGLLIAGSDDYSNYRHQADIGHAYQILRAGGIPAEDIIVMVANDVPKASRNPFPGKMFNKPSTGAGVNVWEDIKIDYQGSQVTAENFLAVLSGNSTATGKVIESGPNDNIFVFYSDHGSPGLIAMPHGPVLTVGQLKNTLIQMNEAKQFNKLVFYLEACESGSMFDGWLTGDMNIYATTAANSVEPSWGFYCSPQDVINNKKIGSCLGDEYSVAWMESVDEIGYGQTLQENYEFLKKKVQGSHVQQFGDLSIADQPLSNWISAAGATLPKPTPKSVEDAALAATTSKISSRDILVHSLFERHTAEGASSEEKFEAGLELIKELQSRLSADMRFRQLAASVLGQNAAVDANTAYVAPAVECGRCCETAYNFLSTDSNCKFTDYSLKYGRTIQNVCMMNNEANVDRTEVVLSKLQSLCSKNYF